MQITFTLRQQDFFESIIAIRNRKPWMKWAFRFVIAALVCIFIWRLAAFVRYPAGAKLSDVVTPIVLLGIWAFLMWGSPWRFARMQFLKQPSAQGERTALLDFSGVQWHWDGGSASVEWRTYTHWMETKNEILLFTSPVQCGIIPKRNLQPEQLAEMRKMLADSIGAGRSA